MSKVKSIGLDLEVYERLKRLREKVKSPSFEKLLSDMMDEYDIDGEVKPQEKKGKMKKVMKALGDVYGGLQESAFVKNIQAEYSDGNAWATQ